MPHPRIFAAAVFRLERKEEPSASTSDSDKICFIEDEKDLEAAEIKSELFYLQNDQDRIIIFRPESGACILVNEDSAALIEKIRNKEKIHLDRKTLAVINYFILFGIISAEPMNEGNEACDVSIEPPSEFKEKAFEPTGVILCPTSDCNLRCIYCYASGGKQANYMDISLARKAIDFIVANALKKGENNISITFHGGGEPTLAFDFIKQTVTYAKDKSRSHGLKLSLQLGTNLYIGEEILDYLLENFNGATVSLDGPRDIQDHQRPALDGKSSFDVVVNNLRKLDEKGFKYGIRSTITGYSLHRMEEMIEFFANNFKSSKSYHFEPLVIASRAVENALEAVSYEEFADEILQAEPTARRLGKEINTVCTDAFSTGLKFCGALHGSFWLTPDGDITTCAEVLYRRDPLSEYFIIGRYDPERGTFVVKKEKLARLRQRDVNNIAGCKHCFAKYHCRGYCPVRVLRQGWGFMDMKDFPACPSIRKMLQIKFSMLMKNKEFQLAEDDYLALGEPDKLQESDIQTKWLDI
jgi:uncharacterized protein